MLIVLFSSTRGFDCKLVGPASAKCDFFLNGTHALERGHFPYEVSGTEYSENLLSMYITAGFDKLSEVTATTTPGPASTAVSRSGTLEDKPQETKGTSQAMTGSTASSGAISSTTTATTIKSTDKPAAAPRRAVSVALGIILLGGSTVVSTIM